jgi:hypothetical protein|tara:strand:+ start:25 stop:258 length:234 start_codon:yes stop_codon:yes gene_type:complete
MSSSIFITAVAVSISYLVFRFIEMRIILKKNKPLKVLARDTLLVYLSVLLGNFIMNQFGSSSMGKKMTEVFTNSPEF